jgi:bifunctional oligoribonuclease and PAP phosphatase NrnA
MPKATLAQILAALRSAESFLITSHENPDGDAVGSMLCAYHLLRVLGKKSIICVNDDPVPRIYSWLPSAGLIVQSASLSSRMQVPVVIVVDAASKARIGRVAELVEPGAQWIMIDHHLDEHYSGDLAFVDPAYSAAGEILVELFDEAGLEMSREAATCAYVSIATDTGGFRYANTTPRSHRIAARLLEAGINAAAISSKVFDVMSGPKFEMLKRVVERTQRIVGGRIAYSTITSRDAEETAARGEDFDGLINLPRNIEGVEVGILFREAGPATTKVSMRSRDTFNCAAFLEQLGGGGHAGAAGATIEAPLAETRCMVLERLKAALGDLA